MPGCRRRPLSQAPRRSALLARAAGLVLGVAADRVVRDPQRHHPVAWFGTAADRLEKAMWRDDPARGMWFTAACLVPLAVAGIGAERATDRVPVAKCLATAVTTWAALGASSLAREGRTMARHLDAAADRQEGDHLAGEGLAAARAQLPNLCGRDAAALDAPELARATVESMAENTSDAAVATVFWGCVAGLPGILVHRGANTLDAMVGHHNARFERFGGFAARLDDVLDWVPARLTGVLLCAASPAVGGSPARAWRVMMRDHASHPSPNGGWCESAMAGALGVRLGGTNVYYGNRVEQRGLLGDGPRPDADGVRAAARLVGLVTAAGAGIATLALVAAGGTVGRTHGTGARGGLMGREDLG